MDDNSIPKYPSEEMAEKLGQLFMDEENALKECLKNVAECLEVNRQLRDSCLEALRLGYELTDRPLGNLNCRLDRPVSDLNRAKKIVEGMCVFIQRKDVEYGISLHFAGMSGY